MLPIEFKKSETDDLVWVSEQVYDNNIGDMKEKVSSMLYQMGIKGTLSTIYGEGFFSVKIKFHTEEDKAVFLLYNFKDKKEDDPV